MALIPTNVNEIDSWREELDGYWKEMQGFHLRSDIETILRTLSAFSARAGYLHNQTVRSSNRAVIDFRTKEVDKFHEEVGTQFKIWSRIGTVVQAEWENTR
jgi:hypothetical protein